MNKFFKTVFLAGVLSLTLNGSGNGEDTGAFPPFDFQFHQITTEDGLSQLNVQVIYQDSYGFMWMGTENGLNRFDGYEFKVYAYEPDDPHSLNHNHISSLYEDSKGDFWVGTLGGGLHLYDRDRDRFERIVGDPDDWKSLSDNSVWSITEDHLGNIWIGTSYGLNLLHREDFTTDKYFYEEDNPESLSDFDVSVVYEDSRKNLWVGTNDGLNLMDREEGTFTRFKHNPDNPNSISSSQISTVYEDSDGVLWIGTLGGGLNYYNYETNTFVSYINDVSVDESIYDNFVHTVMEDSEGLLWVGMGAQGLNIFDRENEQFHLIGPDPESGSEYALSGINSIYESRENILWVGSYSGSIHFMDRKLQFFSNISPVKHSLSGLGDDRVRSFAQAQDGKIWFGTDGGGLGLYDPATGNIDAHRHDPDNRQSIPGDIILALHKGEGELWLGSYARGVSRLDLDTWEFRHFRNDPSDPGSLSSNDVYCLFEDSDGDLWVGTNRGGLNRLKPGADSFIRYTIDPENPESILNNDVRSVFEDRRGNLWIGTYSGLLTRFDKQTNRFSHYDINYGAKYYSSVIQVFLEDGEGRFWLGTRSAGLQKFDRDREEVAAVYGVDQGLSGNVIHGMLEDDNGIIWVSTENGISRFDPDTGHIQNFDEYSGFMEGEFIPASYFKDENGTLYFGGVDGFSRFHPDEIDLTDHEHPVVFTDFLISNRPVSPGEEGSPLQKQIHLTEELAIPYRKASHLTFRFSALNFSPKKNNQFAYMLEGFDYDWNYVGSQRTATYTNLDPGNYVLRVMATNNNGIWPDNSTDIALVITPPFWRTAWFILLGVVFSGALIVFIFKFRVHTLNERRKELERLVEERTAELQVSNSTKNKLFSIIAHDLNNVAFGMYGFIELLQEGVENNNMSEVKEYTAHLQQVSSQYHDLLENLLTWARSQSEGFEHRPEMIQIAELVEEHIQQIRSRAQQKSIRLQTSVDRDLEVYADRNMLSTVFRNLLHNSLKFTKDGGWVEVVSDEKEDIIEISVIDNGIGMSQDQLEKIRSSGEALTTKGTKNEVGTGLGLMLCKDFIAQNGGRLFVESTKNEGSRFSFTLPRGPEVLE